MHELIVVHNGAAVREGDGVDVDAVGGDGDARVREDAGEGFVLSLVELAVVDDMAFVVEAAEDAVGADGDDAVPFFAERGGDIEGIALDVAEGGSWGDARDGDLWRVEHGTLTNEHTESEEKEKVCRNPSLIRGRGRVNVPPR